MLVLLVSGESILVAPLRETATCVEWGALLFLLSSAKAEKNLIEIKKIKNKQTLINKAVALGFFSLVNKNNPCVCLVCLRETS